MEDLTGQQDTVDSISAAQWNAFQQEFKNLITPVETMMAADLNQLRRTILHVAVNGAFMVDGGSVNAHRLSVIVGNPPNFLPRTGALIRFRPANDNTSGAPTLELVFAFAARTITREDGSVLQQGDLSTTRDALVRLDLGANRWRLLNASLGQPPLRLPLGYIVGLEMSRNPAEHSAAPSQFRDVAILKGRCRDANDTVDIIRATPLRKRFDAKAAVGQSAGGFPSDQVGARQVSTWYRFFVVAKSVTGEVDAGWDTAPGAPNLLTALNAISAGWDAWRQLGWTRTTPGNALELEPFMNDPNDPELFVWTAGQGFADWDPGVFDTTTSAQAPFTVDFAPPDSIAILDASAFGFGENAAGSLVVQPAGHPDVVPSPSVSSIDFKSVANAGTATPAGAISSRFGGTVEVRLDGNRQANVRVNSSGKLRPYFTTRGFRFSRTQL